jgi:glycosyltransferase involved in cell wall biosynthesis
MADELTSGVPSERIGEGRRSLRLAFLGDVNSVHLRVWTGFLAARGHHITALVADDRAVEPGLAESIRIERFRSFAVRRRVTPLSLLRGRRSIREAVRRVQPDVLNAHFLTVHGWNAWLSGFHPYVVTLWGSDVFIHPGRSRIARTLARLTLRAADMVMINPVMRDAALAAGADPERLRAVTIGVDVRRFSPGLASPELRARLALAGKRVVFAPRTIAPLYRQGVVVEALSRLPGDVVLVMSTARAEAGELARIERLAAELGLSERLVLVPKVSHDDMTALYRLADAVVSIPASDSASVTMLEALACERPVVVSDLPAIRQWLDGSSGLELVPVDDPAATADAIARLLDEPPADRAKRVAGLRARVVEGSDQARTLAALENMYYSLLGRRNGPVGGS